MNKEQFDTSIERLSQISQARLVQLSEDGKIRDLASKRLWDTVLEESESVEIATWVIEKMAECGILGFEIAYFKTQILEELKS